MSKSFSKAINDLKGVPEQKARAAALNLYNVIVDQSHVVSGRYRANWQISAGSPKLNQINSTQKPSGDASSVMNSISTGKSAPRKASWMKPPMMEDRISTITATAI